MHIEILSAEQIALMPFIQSFKKEFYLVGGTAIALQIGHRASIDFDLFKFSNIQSSKIGGRLKEFNLKYQLLFEDTDGMHILVDGVKITFYHFPFKIQASLNFEGIKIPDLLHLAAMKAYALGRRAKWKDYVDLYFILRDFHSVTEIATTSKAIFGDLFSTKLFLQQLCYFEDVKYEEEIEYLANAAVPDTTVKKFLEEISTANF